MARMVKTKTSKKAPKAKSRPAAKKASAKPVKQVKATKALKPEKKLGAALGEGSPVPAFAMPATVLGEVSLSRLKGKPFVLYFYPKDDTSGCTAQACSFRDAVPAFGKLGLTVIGVSKDGLASHEKFGKKYGLTFPLASDEKTRVCEAFGTWVQKSMYGRSYMGIERSTFLVDGKGVIHAVWRKVSVPGHVDEVKKAVANL